MISNNECNSIFDQLAQMLHFYGREDIVMEVKAQITSLDAIPANKWIEAEEHFRPQAKHHQTRQKKQNIHQSPLPFIKPQPAKFPGKELSSLEELDEGILSDYLYPPDERLKLLLRAIEAAFPIPIIMGLTILDLFNQNEIHFETTSRAEDSFTLLRSELQAQEQNAQNLLQYIKQLRNYIDREDKTP